VNQKARGPARLGQFAFAEIFAWRIAVSGTTFIGRCGISRGAWISGFSKPGTNVEPPFAAVRLRTAAAKRFKKVENATALIWKTLLVAEQTFRRLDSPELLAEVAERVVCVGGVREKRGNEKAAA
jgi:hypothetical protein